VSNFVVQALQGQELTVYGTGEQTRSFCYVDDLVTGLIQLMNTEKGATIHYPVNLGNPHEFTICELAHQVAELCGNRGTRIVFRPLPQDDPRQRQPDISRARDLLQWAPTIELREGLTRTIAYFRDRNPRSLPGELTELTWSTVGVPATPSGEVQAIETEDWTSLV
jgi:UDP-glucuronate decarboxylase